MVSDPPPFTTASAPVLELMPLAELVPAEVLTTLPEVLTMLREMPVPKMALRAAFVKMLVPVALVPAVALVPPLPVAPDIVPLELLAPPLLEVAALLPELETPLLVLALLPLPALELLLAPEVSAPDCAAALLTALASSWRKRPTSLWTCPGSPP